MANALRVISARVQKIRAAADPDFLLTLPSGHAVLGKQPAALRGCCMLLPDPVTASVNDLDFAARERFFGDLVLLGDAVLAVTGAERINYLVLCNQAPELHGHCIPRFAAEDAAKRLLGPFEAYDFGAAPAAEVMGVDRELHSRLRAELSRRLAGRADAARKRER